jgi:hypothetical protein
VVSRELGVRHNGTARNGDVGNETVTRAPHDHSGLFVASPRET